MEINSLYRKYRPDTFDKVIGQDHIVRTLKNQIKRGKVGHAYLFCGTRGTGKTSTAKIFARALNCLHPVDGSPCGECVPCVELARPNVDIIEIDAASNNGVDEIRELKERINYRSAIANKRVYIIDEVHMLTASAFNALLKTLEEPPEHIVFILATTEPHKIPATILSRCLRFDFKLISAELIEKQITEIFLENNIKFEEAAVRLIAASGNGSDRDALSLAEMCLSYSSDAVTYENVLNVLGALNPEHLLSIVEAILSADSGAALAAVSNAVSSGGNIGVIASDIAAALRNAVFIRACDNAADALKLEKSEFEWLSRAAAKLSPRKIIKALDIFSTIENDLRYSTQPRIILESAVVRAAEAVGELSELENIQKTVAELEKIVRQKKNLNDFGLSDGRSSGFFGNNLSNLPKESAVGQGLGAPAVDAVEAVFSQSVDDTDAASVWSAVTQRISATKAGFLHIAMEALTPYIENGELVVEVEEQSPLIKNKTLVLKALDEVGSKLKLTVKLKERKDHNTLISKLLEDFDGEIAIKDLVNR
ncbi:MAG TPA: DNA polymerase III subunit gamma/tau [Eubacteriales bacterium]|nr:DNA polymerase III subunit gamma/tau [Clostridia bacterium]HRR89502.1 DNA polymerase III subunit gamma/tau [Eubacteriales bacterium]